MITLLKEGDAVEVLPFLRHDIRFENIVIPRRFPPCLVVTVQQVCAAASLYTTAVRNMKRPHARKFQTAHHDGHLCAVASMPRPASIYLAASESVCDWACEQYIILCITVCVE